MPLSDIKISEKKKVKEIKLNDGSKIVIYLVKISESET